MLIGFSKHGTGRASRPVDYLTAETVQVSTGPVGYLTGGKGKKGVRREPFPVVVRGDSVRVKEVIDSVKFKHKYTSGVLSFSPNEIITPAMEEKIITEFEQTAFAGLSSDRYEILWVRHQHTKAHRHELHFLTPRLDLVTGKSLNIAPPRKSTRELFDTLRSKINAEYGLADPSDPARARKGRVPSHRAKIKAVEQDASKIINLRSPKGSPNPERARLLEAQLQKMVERRTAYHHERYAAAVPKTLVPEAQKLTPIYDRARTPSPECPQPARIPISGARPAVCRHAGDLEQATERWRQACGTLESSHSRFERAYRTIASSLERKMRSLMQMARSVSSRILSKWPLASRQIQMRPDDPAQGTASTNPLLTKYGIPSRPTDRGLNQKRRVARGMDIEPEMTRDVI